MKKLLAIFLAAAGLALGAPTQPINNATLTGTTNLGSKGTIDNTTGNIVTQGTMKTGSGGTIAGALGYGNGTPTTAQTGEVGFMAPATVTTPFYMKLPAAPITGLLKSTGTTDPTTITFIPTGTGVDTALGINTGSAGAFQVNNASGAGLTSLTAANISAGALANGMTATTQSAGDNSTKLATTAYADAAVAAGVTASSTTTLTNKRITARVGSTTSSATPTINTDNCDVYKLTAQAADITSMTTNLSGTPVDGDQLELRITGTAARAITWGTGFVAGPAALPTTTTTTKTLYVYFEYDSVVTHWVCMYSGSLP